MVSHNCYKVGESSRKNLEDVLQPFSNWKKKKFEAEIRYLSTFTTYLVSIVALFLRPSSNQYLKPCTFVKLERQTDQLKCVSCALLLTYEDYRLSCSLELMEENPAVRLNILK